MFFITENHFLLSPYQLLVKSGKYDINSPQMEKVVDYKSYLFRCYIRNLMTDGLLKSMLNKVDLEMCNN